MNYLKTAIAIIGSTTFIGGTTIPYTQQIVQNRAEYFYNQGVSKTQREDYRGAIADLQTAANLFTQQRNPTNAYKSKALAIYLQFSERRLQPSHRNETLPNWYKLGQCLGEPTCQYGVVWIDPETRGTPFGGILILDKKLRMLERPDGSGEPIEAILDVRVVPRISRGEWLQGNCQIRDKSDPQILAIVQVQGFENEDLYTKVKQVWRINLTTEKIDSIPTTNVACINPCPGGC